MLHAQTPAGARRGCGEDRSPNLCTVPTRSEGVVTAHRQRMDRLFAERRDESLKSPPASAVPGGDARRESTQCLDIRRDQVLVVPGEMKTPPTTARMGTSGNTPRQCVKTLTMPACEHPVKTSPFPRTWTARNRSSMMFGSSSKHLLEVDGVWVRRHPPFEEQGAGHCASPNSRSYQNTCGR